MIEIILRQGRALARPDDQLDHGRIARYARLARQNSGDDEERVVSVTGREIEGRIGKLLWKTCALSGLFANDRPIKEYNDEALQALLYGAVHVTAILVTISSHARR